MVTFKKCVVQRFWIKFESNDKPFFYDSERAHLSFMKQKLKKITNLKNVKLHNLLRLVYVFVKSCIIPFLTSRKNFKQFKALQKVFILQF